MTTRLSQTWQITLADLSLILFIISASAVSLEKNKPAEDKAQATAPEQQDLPKANSPAKERAAVAPVAFFRDVGDDAALGDWLSRYAADPREQLTIRATYANGEFGKALERTSALASETQAAGKFPRIVIEEGAKTNIIASFAFEGASPESQYKLAQ